MDSDAFGLARIQFDALKTHQCLRHYDNGRIGRWSDINLCHFGALARACVAHREAHVGSLAITLDRELTVFIAGVGQAVAEREEWLDSLLIVPSVADGDPF